VRAIFSKTIIFYSYFVGIGIWFGLRIAQGGNYLNWQLWIPVLSWLIGGFIGRWLISFDRLVDVYFAHPETQLSHYVRYYLQKGQWRWAWTTLNRRKNEQLRLTFRSGLFQIIWVGLAIFALTSTASLLGKAVVMGGGLYLLLDEWEDYFHDPNFLRSWLFWQIKREVSLKEQKGFLWAMTGIMVILTLVIL